MTVLTFPTNPTPGQLYNAPNQIRYVFDGVKWIVETVASTSLAVTNSVQDRVAPMFVNGPNTGINFTYNAGTNVMSANVTSVNGDSLINGVHEFTLEANGTLSLDGSPFNNLTVATSTVLGGVKLGEGFTTDVNSKVTTNKLYSTNLTQPTQHYRLEVDTNGVIILPDQSIINGSYMRAIHGSYAGLAAGPDLAHNEDSWMWVDADGAWIATKYSTDAFTWKFDNNGILNFPNNNGQIGQLESPYTGLEFRTGSGADWIGISYGEINDNNTSYFYFDKDGSNYLTANHRAHLQIKNPAHNGHVEWLFESDGKLTLPTNGTISYAPDDTDNWNVPAVNTISAALDELALRLTAVENIEIEGGNAYAMAGPELIIDGNGA